MDEEVLDDDVNAEEEAPEEVTDVETEEEGESEGGEQEAPAEEEVITIDGVAPPQEAESSVIREARKREREKDKRIRDLEEELKARSSSVESVTELGARPTLEQFGYDDDEFTKALDVWYQQKQKVDAHKSSLAQRAKAEEAELAALVAEHSNKAKAMNRPDFEEVAQSVAYALSPQQQVMLLNAAQDSAKLTYALGMHPERLKEVASISNPAKFIAAIVRLEGKVSMEKRAVPAPEKALSGGSPAVSSDKKLAQLEAEAERTGDRSKVQAYKRQMRERKG